MTEKLSKVDLHSLPFDERADRFGRLVKVVGIVTGGDDEHDLRTYGQQIVELHKAETDEDKEKIRSEIDKMLNKLGESKNPKTGEAVVNILFAEMAHF